MHMERGFLFYLPIILHILVIIHIFTCDYETIIVFTEEFLGVFMLFA